MNLLIPLSIILDCLNEYNYDSHVSGAGDVKFGWVNMFPPKQRALSSDHIYIGKLSDIMSAEWRGDVVCCIALRDRIKDDAETEERLKNLIVLNCNSDILDVFGHVQRTFYEIFNWHDQMNEYIIQNRSLQDLLVLSEPIIGNFITISDSSLSLMAYTPDLECDCPVTNALVKNGYHSDSTVSMFQRYRMPERWSYATDIYVNDSRAVSPYPYACKVVRYNNAYFAHVVMICNVKLPTPGVLDLFRMLLDHLMVCFERIWHTGNEPVHIYDSILKSLIEDKNLPGDIVRERARYSGLPMEARFRLLKIAPDDEANSLMQRLAQEIIDRFPEVKVTQYGKSLVVLIVHIRETDDRVSFIRETVEQVMERYATKCGMSDQFDQLPEVGSAYEQADVALRYGSCQMMLPFSGNALKGPLRMYAYEEYYPCYLLCGTKENARLANHTKASVALRRLYEYDMQHDTNNLELLYLYLNNDRRATETAAVLHMHRNNVVYRISRIEDLIGMDLNDSSVRFRLRLAYEVFTPPSAP